MSVVKQSRSLIYQLQRVSARTAQKQTHRCAAPLKYSCCKQTLNVNSKMHNMGQIDPNDATHVYCLKRFVSFLTTFLEFFSELVNYPMR